MKIYVGNLPSKMTKAELRQAFEDFGLIIDAYIIRDRKSKGSRSFGFVRMPNRQEAKVAIDSLNGQSFGGRKLVVERATPRKEIAELIAQIEKHKNQNSYGVRANLEQFLDGFEQISRKFELRPRPVDESAIEKAFLFKPDDIPDKGPGAYVALSDDELTLIVHTFTRVGKPWVKCWRARLINHEDAEIIFMPPKYHQGYRKKNVWREILIDFLSDVEQMIYNSGTTRCLEDTSRRIRVPETAIDTSDNVVITGEMLREYDFKGLVKKVQAGRTGDNDAVMVQFIIGSLYKVYLVLVKVFNAVDIKMDELGCSGDKITLNVAKEIIEDVWNLDTELIVNDTNFVLKCIGILKEDT